MVLNSFEDEEKYQMALDTVRCYGRHFEYDVHIFHGKNEKKISEKCQQADVSLKQPGLLRIK